MKVKCPDCRTEKVKVYGFCDTCGNHGTPGFLDVTISTAELIAELKKRSPDCRKCVRSTALLCFCTWNVIFEKDLFKEK